jgi:hypothetical protein
MCAWHGVPAPCRTLCWHVLHPRRYAVDCAACVLLLYAFPTFVSGILCYVIHAKMCPADSRNTVRWHVLLTCAGMSCSLCAGMPCSLCAGMPCRACTLVLACPTHYVLGPCRLVNRLHAETRGWCVLQTKQHTQYHTGMSCRLIDRSCAVTRPGISCRLSMCWHVLHCSSL